MTSSAGTFGLAIDPLRAALPALLAGLGVAVLIGLIAFSPWMRSQGQAVAARIILVRTTFVAALLAVSLFAFLAFYFDNVGIRVDNTGLTIAELGEKHLTWRELRLNSVKVEDLGRRQVLAPVGDLSSLSFPGLTRGWMRLASGRPAFVILPTHANQVVYISTRHPFDLLLGVEAPSELVKAIEDASRGSAS
jgi:hypothetical protein